MPLPKIGATPPPFTLPNQDGRKISLSDYKGRNVLIWFYPRAFGNN
jgi:peroxiredoxin Q/BCP